MRIPSFILSLNGPAKENEGEVLAASLRWSGSFQFAFDVDWNKNLRLLTGMNPLGSQYNLERGGTLLHPPFSTRIVSRVREKPVVVSIVGLWQMPSAMQRKTALYC